MSKHKMRDATPEEKESITKYIESISKPTGLNIFDDKLMCERLKGFVEFLYKKIDSECEKNPTSFEDAIRTYAYCLAWQQDIWALENILNGKDWDYKE